MSLSASKIDEYLESLNEYAKAGYVHIIDTYFIKGMYDKKMTHGQELSFPEASAIEQLYNTIMIKGGRT